MHPFIVFEIFFFVLGTIFASFAGVVASRLHTGTPMVKGRSRCDACGAVLSSLDLIPIVSYLLRRGRARCCGARVSIISTLGEILLGALFLLSYRTLGPTLALGVFLASLVLLYTLVLYDLAHQILPPALLYPFVVLALFYLALTAPSTTTILSSGLTALGIGLFLWLIYLFSRGRAMGFADAPLAFALALLVAPRALAGFAFSFWLGAAIGISMVALSKGGVRMKSEVPLAPFLAAGFLLAYFIPWDPFAPLLALISSI